MIGVELGLIRSQDAPSVSEVASRLSMIYRHHLEEFDKIYVASFTEEREERMRRARSIR